MSFGLVVHRARIVVWVYVTTAGGHVGSDKTRR